MNSPIEKPTRPCFNCGSEEWWQRVPEGQWICMHCHPPPQKDNFIIRGIESA